MVVLTLVMFICADVWPNPQLCTQHQLHSIQNKILDGLIEIHQACHPLVYELKARDWHRILQPVETAAA